MFRFLLRFYLVPPTLKVLLLWLGILALSAVKKFADVPETYFARRNFFNTYFVKWSWGWTLLFVTPYMVLMAGVSSCEHWKRGVAAALTRLAVATGIWYFWTTVVFHAIENLTGVCLDGGLNPMLDVLDKKSCLGRPGRHRWEALDISGHAFLLTFISLLISSELQIHRYWHYIPTHAAQYLPIGSRALQRLKTRHKTVENAAKMMFIVNCFVSIFWEFFLACTCIYFHDFFSKAIGASVGIISWMVSYSELYRNKRIPLYPGHGPIKDLLIPSSNGKESEKKNS